MLSARLCTPGLIQYWLDLAKDSPFPSANDWVDAIDEKTLALVTVVRLGLRDPFTPAQSDRRRTAVRSFHRGLLPDSSDGHHRESGSQLCAEFRSRQAGLAAAMAVLRCCCRRTCVRVRCLKLPARVCATYIGTAVAARLYNVLCSPWLYGWVTRVPGFGVGMTGYSQLRSIGAMNEHVRDYLDPGAGWNDPRRRNLQATIRELLDRSALPASQWICGSVLAERESWLLRYPLLLKNQTHARRMLWPDSTGTDWELPECTCIPCRKFRECRPLCRVIAWRMRDSFAGRLLTLPLHGDVREAVPGRCAGFWARLCAQ